MSGCCIAGSCMHHCTRRFSDKCFSRLQLVTSLFHTHKWPNLTFEVWTRNPKPSLRILIPPVAFLKQVSRNTPRRLLPWPPAAAQSSDVRVGASIDHFHCKGHGWSSDSPREQVLLSLSGWWKGRSARALAIFQAFRVPMLCI